LRRDGESDVAERRARRLDERSRSVVQQYRDQAVDVIAGHEIQVTVAVDVAGGEVRGVDARGIVEGPGEHVGRDRGDVEQRQDDGGAGAAPERAKHGAPPWVS